MLGEAYELVREHLTARQKNSKDLYDLGVNKKIFEEGDKVRIRLKAIPKSAGKLLSKWSDLYEVVGVRGVVVELREPGGTKIIRVHADRLSNIDHHLREEPRDDSFNILPSNEHASLFENDDWLLNMIFCMLVVH